MDALTLLPTVERIGASPQVFFFELGLVPVLWALAFDVLELNGECSNGDSGVPAAH